MQVIDQVLELLAQDKAWHTVEDIAQKTRVSKAEAEEVTDFLASLTFVQLDKDRKKAKIDERTNRFLTEIKSEEGPEINELSVPR